MFPQKKKWTHVKKNSLIYKIDSVHIKNVSYIVCGWVNEPNIWPND